MVPTLKTLLATLLLATMATAAPSPDPVELIKRVTTGAQIWTSGACDSQPVYSGTYSSGTCHNFPNGGGKYGAKFQDSSVCKYKVWENQGCTGKATVHGQNGNNCIPIANVDGTNTFYLHNGGASVSIVC